MCIYKKLITSLLRNGNDSTILCQICIGHKDVPYIFGVVLVNQS